MSSNKKLITPIPLLEFNLPKQINVGMLGWGRRNWDWEPSVSQLTGQQIPLVYEKDKPAQHSRNTRGKWQPLPPKQRMRPRKNASSWRQWQIWLCWRPGEFPAVSEQLGGQQGWGSNISKCVIGRSEAWLSAGGWGAKHVLCYCPSSRACRKAQRRPREPQAPAIFCGQIHHSCGMKVNQMLMFRNSCSTRVLSSNYS